jgi:hypothetical protein
VSDMHDRMIGAYRSRDHGTRLLREIGDLHAPVPNGCSCGKRKDCETARIIDRGWVQERFRDLERREHRPDYYGEELMEPGNGAA